MKKKDKSKQQVEEGKLQLIEEAAPEPEETTPEPEETTPEPEETTPEPEEAIQEPEEASHPYAETRPDNSDVFAVLDQENKWERKERKKEEKIKAKEAKKRAKYGDVDDDTYYSMKAHPAHVAFGVMSILLVFVGMAVATLCVYKLAIAPSYATLKDSEENLSIAGLASPGDSSLMQQRPALAGLATSSDALYDTWVEEEFEATATDAETGVPEEPTDEDTASQEAVEE